MSSGLEIVTSPICLTAVEGRAESASEKTVRVLQTVVFTALVLHDPH